MLFPQSCFEENFIPKNFKIWRYKGKRKKVDYLKIQKISRKHDSKLLGWMQFLTIIEGKYTDYEQEHYLTLKEILA